MAIFVISLNWYTRWRSPGVQNCGFWNLLTKYGTPDRIRTYDLLLRKQTLYPAELRVHMWISSWIAPDKNIHLEIK